MHFTHLRLQGFKSFVEPTDLPIPEGLTGIVGPNGCGKSNLVEALRWVMGENSPRRMRGAEMDDVIFGGTATRPSRNIAEVSLMLDNANRSATAEFNSEDSLQVTRRIERENGSDYRINGRPVRQRDVQMLFADQSTGAHSTNLVGQGQIDALIRAKPQDRRAILEEASGTAGLQARRHEAELKLKGAEQNLTRVDDVLKAYDTQLRSLKGQVRQASRYRNLAEHIRRTEAALLQLRWAEAEGNAEATRQALITAEQRVSELLLVTTQGSTSRTAIAAELPGLRATEAAAAAIVQKLTLTREQLEAETQRIADETQRHEQRLTQARADQSREQLRQEDGLNALSRLAEEDAALAGNEAEIAAQLPQVQDLLQSISAEVEALDAGLSQLMQSLATTEARRQSLTGEIALLTAQHTTLTRRREQLDAQRSSLAGDVASRPDLSFASALVAASETELVRRQSQAQSAEQTYREAEQLQNAARDLSREAQAQVTTLKAEAQAIEALLQPQDADTKQVIDLITVQPGFEQALAVALGEALTAALDDTKASHWRELPPLSDAAALPDSISPLANYIAAPAALNRSLSQIGLAETAASGAAAAASLRPGQIIVSRDGWAWRWDGFTVTPQARTATGLRLQQRNRLTALAGEIAQAATEYRSAETAVADAASLFTTRQAEDRQARDALKAAFAALDDARQTYARQEKEASVLTTQLGSLDASLRQLADELRGIGDRAHAYESELAALPDGNALKTDIVERKQALAEQRNAQARQQGEADRLTRERNGSQQRRKAIAQDITDWQARLAHAGAQLNELSERIATAAAQLAQLQARPAELAARRSELLTELQAADIVRQEAADTLINAEHRLQTVEQQLKRDEDALSVAKEDRVRSEGAVQAASEHFTTLRERMNEKLNCGPEELAAIASLDPAEDNGAAQLEETLSRYTRERDNMGPVNLRAEAEAETLQAAIDQLQQEKDDLTAAIAKLRQGIGTLNREARERLQSAFTLVNERFQQLFQRLFTGGKAHLELIDHEDPMEAGLEIFAAPPGKKSQILSLLSGGERTLTALALLFAVFQTNPSPICVLDEAEAALDESNIGRFCSLIEDVGRETGTRFLVITHQRLTMARMDRLYGVTMSEKGVSQLVSVDLAKAVAIRDAEAAEAGFGKAEAALQDVQAA